MTANEKNNGIIKCMVGGQSHFKHILTGEMAAKISFIENRYPAANLPVCEHCERLALWGHSIDNSPIGVCPVCGTVTSMPVRYAEYLVANGLDLDF